MHHPVAVHGEQVAGLGLERHLVAVAVDHPTQCAVGGVEGADLLEGGAEGLGELVGEAEGVARSRRCRAGSMGAVA